MASDSICPVKTLTVTDVARNFSSVLDELENDQEDVLLVRNHKCIARLVPESPAQNALEVLGDLYRTLDEKTAEALSAGIRASRSRKKGTLAELRNPWDS